MALTTEQKNAWEENGYLLLKKFYSAAQVDEINDLVDRLWRERRTLDGSYVIDIFVETEQERRVYFSDAPKQARKQPYKLNDLFLSQAAIRNMVAGEQLAPVLRELLQDTPMICNSLNFEFGSQQEYHFDTFYMPSPTPNKMIASWIALEDATPQNGPLTYYPGSHKIPAYQFSNGSTVLIDEEHSACNEYVFSEIEKRGLKPEILLANKGDVLIWHSQLFHGGNPILNKKKTRKSLVTHYFTREDFPDLDPPKVTEDSCFMARVPQPVNYEYKEYVPTSWFDKTFG